MRKLASLRFLAICAAPLAAQDFDRPDGWTVRFGRPGQTEADLDTCVEMPPGWHVGSGPAALYWGPDMDIPGDLRAEQVATVPRSEASVDGVFGFRVNHALNLHISKIEITPLC